MDVMIDIENALNDGRMLVKQLLSAPPLYFGNLTLSDIPEGISGVYAIFDSKEVLYVGRTKNLRRRLYTNHLHGPKSNGIFITEQVGGENDRDLVEMVLPDTPKPFPQLNLATQRANFERAGFQIIKAEEAFRPIEFYDVGAFVWFAHIIEWEFPTFSVDKCFEQLLKMQEAIDNKGKVEGTIHRYLIVAKK